MTGRREPRHEYTEAPAADRIVAPAVPGAWAVATGSPPTRVDLPFGVPSAASPASRHRRGTRALGLYVALAVAGLGVGTAIGYGAFSENSTRSVVVHTASISASVSQVDRGLVDIDTVLGYETAKGAGTGMVLTSTGLVLTNNHVIEEATSMSVTDIGNGRTYRASVVGYDKAADVAVIKLDDASGLVTVSFGDSSSVHAGETVIGIGNAGGKGGTPSVARGTVTALAQSITAEDEATDHSEQLRGLIETDAAIEAGDSGGPLVDSEGEVIGMDTAASSSSGVTSAVSPAQTTTKAYAIPINRVLAVATEIDEGTTTSGVHLGATAFLGVVVESPGPSSSAEKATSSGDGALVVRVEGGSPAASVGLTAGDVITGVDGVSVTSPTTLSEALETLSPGTSASVKWTTDTGESESATVDLVAGPAG